MIKAVIFDADGPLYFRSKNNYDEKLALINKFGNLSDIDAFNNKFDTEKYVAFVGDESIDDMFSNILASVNIRLDNDDLEAFVNSFDHIQSDISIAPNAKSVLKQVKQKGYNTCVLTDSYYSSDQKWPWFEKLGIRELIDEMVSSIDIQKLKSTVDAYKACMKLLDAKPNEVVFVGHQQYEMDGAKQAGVASIALANIVPTDTINADYIIESIADLPSLLRKLNQ